MQMACAPQICALAEAIVMEKLSPTAGPAHCVLSKQRELQVRHVLCSMSTPMGANAHLDQQQPMR
jgi:hypothetical protein